jgi:L-ribulokinase
MEQARPGDSGDAFVVGVDFGTLTGRAVVVRVSDGKEFGAAALDYPHGVFDTTLAETGVALKPAWALQVASDYVAVLKSAVPLALSRAGIDPARVIGIATDFTASTLLPVLADGTPISELPEYVNRPHAYVKLWKHHAASGQANRITALAAERGEPWLSRYGGVISSEWEFAKGLQLLEEDREIYDLMDKWVEAADWIVWQLTGTYVRNSCSAGYKGLFQDGAYPTREFLAALNPDFGEFVDTKLAHDSGDVGTRAGSLCAQASVWTGLPAGIAAAVGNIDAHVTASAAQATAPGRMVAIMGTSTCHIVNSDVLTEVPGMCGVVNGGILPGLYGYEAGQSGVGDLFAWYVANQVPSHYHDEAAERGLGIHQYLSDLSENQPVGGHGLVALDWHGGNRSILVDHELSGLVLGATIATRAEEVYRALVEATAFGARRIVDAFTESGVAVTEFIVAGGLVKNAFLMQIYSDVLRLPISTIASREGPALGSAIHAAVAAGAYDSIFAASEAMGQVSAHAYRPRDHEAAVYDSLYAEYLALHDYFGRGGNGVMRRLTHLRRQALAGAVNATVESADPREVRS